jgi:hypothetical protein
MNDIQENQLTMLKAVMALCEANNGVWATDVPFSTSYGLLMAQIEGIETQKAIQATDTGGVATDKKNKRATLEDQTFFVANRIHSYAAATHNQKLLITINYSRSNLKKARDTELLGIAKLVKDTGNATLTSLAPYGVTNGILTNLGSATTNFQNVVSGPRVSRTMPIAASKALDIALRTAMSIINTRLDVDVEVFKPANPAFYTQYQAARQINNVANNPLAVRCIVTDNKDSPLPNVVAVFVETNIIKKTTEKGKFQINHLQPGTYTVNFSKFGYQPAVQTIHISAGETTELKVRLMTA